MGSEPVRLDEPDRDVMGDVEIKTSADFGRESVGAGVRRRGFRIDPSEAVGARSATAESEGAGGE